MKERRWEQLPCAERYHLATGKGMGVLGEKKKKKGAGIVATNWCDHTRSAVSTIVRPKVVRLVS